MPDKVITQTPVKKGDLKDLHVYIDVTGTQTWNALYTPKDATGAPIGEPRPLSGAVTSTATLFAWVDADVIPAINAHEGT